MTQAGFSFNCRLVHRVYPLLSHTHTHTHTRARTLTSQSNTHTHRHHTHTQLHIQTPSHIHTRTHKPVRTPPHSRLIPGLSVLCYSAVQTQSVRSIHKQLSSAGKRSRKKSFDIIRSFPLYTVGKPRRVSYSLVISRVLSPVLENSLHFLCVLTISPVIRSFGESFSSFHTCACCL